MLFYLSPIIILLPPFALVALFMLLLKRISTGKKWFPILNNPKTTFICLLGFLLTGFFFKLDYNLQFGCFVSHESVFSLENIFFLIFALALLSIGIIVPSKKIAATILLIELIFWLYKLFLIKGGYATGAVGAPNPYVLFYDIIVLTLRLMLIKQILFLRFRPFFVLVLSYLIMLTKFYTML